MRLTLDPRSHRPGRVPSPGSVALSLAITVVALSLIGYLDRATGSAPVQHLYYLPIIFAAIRLGYAGGIGAAVAAIVLYHAANPLLLLFQYRELDLVEVALFLAVGVIAARLVSDARRLQSLAMTDDLTGLHNLRSFEASLVRLVQRARATREALSLLVLDLDRLKLLNDEHGHLAGAEAVRTLGRVIAARLPEGAVACRYGGDEFVIACPSISATEVSAFADDLCRRVRACSPTLAGVTFPRGTLSVSVGLAYRQFGADDADQDRVAADVGEHLFSTADAALYRAKRAGRGRVWVA